jgi:hypothetical protein
MRSATLSAVFLCVVVIATGDCAITLTREPHLWRLQDLNRAKQMVSHMDGWTLCN